MGNIVEKFSDITLENADRITVIFANLSGKSLQSFHSPMNAFIKTTRIRVVDEVAVEQMVKNPKQSLMNHPIADRGLVDVAQFGVADEKGLIRTRTISLVE